jgi:CRISPR-associated exonuclease Cas4
MAVLIVLGLICLTAGLALLRQAHRMRAQAGLPDGEVVYADTGGWSECDRPLFSRRQHLTGKPDYIVRASGGLTPIEVKSTRGLAHPYESHVLQLMAYCFLIEEHEAQQPACGLLHYPDRTFRIAYTAAARAQLLHYLAQLRAGFYADNVARSHNDPHRCRQCGLRIHCSQSL